VNVRRDDIPPTVIVIDDDDDVRESLRDLFRSVGMQAELFGSIQDYLGAGLPDHPGCLILDVRLPGRSGLDFQEELRKAKVSLPVIFISGHADIAMSVRAMKAGAVEFLTKPVRPQDLLDAVNIAIENDRARRQETRDIAGISTAYESLSPREREVMAAVVAGCLNKQIAADLGITEATVKLHRGQVMRKMGAGSLANLVRMADRLPRSKPGS
jgi:FixJ family two-component response regulator